ncbi:Leukocyte elastase inhibitor C [Hypsibius exemplaris]|uniref:Leukocyte elastase inhibitor C n=1 Tax=Hypsibius exemplaris TaxID=2072580 RepID=A0A1W0WKC9_HYPEX|nr:Leukocyte elastase inhibitor C [Hypsibius exemplaris]
MSEHHLGSLKKSLDEFSLDLYQQIASDPTAAEKNLFLSPLSISSALLLVYLGARDATQREIEAALRLDKHFGGKKEAVLQAYEEVLRIFVPSVGKDGQPAYSLALANKAYVQTGLPLKPDYVNAITKSLKSEIGQVDFQKNSEGARAEVNQWVEKQTNNKIQNLLAPGSVSAATLLVLVNAIYFKADWKNKFEEKDTQKATFHNIDGQEVQVDLMEHKTSRKYDYYDNFGGNADAESALPPFQMLGIPYKGHEMSMLIFLPREKDGLKDFEKALTVEALEAIHGNGGSRKARVWLPRFKLEESYDLVTILEKTGIRKLFSGQADLSGISETGLSVSGAVHKAFVEVNEKGTEAAAATAMMMTRMAMTYEEPPVEFRADRPFLFAIRHETTGLITFLGRVARLVTAAMSGDRWKAFGSSWMLEKSGMVQFTLKRYSSPVPH